MTPAVSIRADANPRIGYGHMMRMLAVAKQLRETHGNSIQFFSAPDSDTSIVHEAGFKTCLLSGPGVGVDEMLQILNPPNGPVILDSYEVDETDLERLRSAGFRVTLFDDGKRLTNYPCELVIDSAPEAAQLGYSSSTNAHFCLGTDYYPLREEFVKARSKCRVFGPIENILVTFGGSDPFDQTTRVLSLLKQTGLGSKITAILGGGYEGAAEILAATVPEITVHRNPSDIAALMAKSDLAISSAGGTAFEIAYMGLPSLLMSLSIDQEPIARALNNQDCAYNLGHWDRCSEMEIQTAIEKMSRDRDRRERYSRNASDVVDGNGTARIASEILRIWESK